jgi:hypothetical protein
MNTMIAAYKVERTLPDGQKVSVGTFADAKEARKVIDGLSKYWPGDYRILPDSPKDDACRQTLRS